MIDLIIGHPGTGKTTYVSKLIERDSAKYGSEGILVGSFTNTAAHELKGYNIIIKPEMIGTLHSHAYRAIGPGRNIADKMLDKFNEDNPDMPMSGGISPGDDGGFIVGKTDADAAYAKLQVLRNQQMPRELWRGIEGGAAALSFERRWNKFKADHDCIDFTDMIEIALRDTAAHPNNPSISYWDEFQDFTRLEIALIEKWSESMPNGMVIAGDANQCHPPDSLIKTIYGDVRIDELVAGKHKLLSYDKIAGSEIRRRGYDFQVASRPYSGTMHKINGMECTDDHKLMCKWNRNARRAYAVYLMRKGNWWRIGRVPVLYMGGMSEQFGPSMRARQETADAMWILDIVQDEREAAKLELSININYGLPMFLFHADGNSGSGRTNRGILLTNEDIADLQEIHKDIIVEGAEQCLKDYGRNIDCPFWTMGLEGKGFGGKAHFTINACNFFPRYMEIPIYAYGAKPLWLNDFEYCNYQYTGDVYSLNVEKYHMYFCNKVLVHNCLYHFKGSSPEYIMDQSRDLPPEFVTVLNQSYRVPKFPQRYASKWITKAKRYIPANYEPKNADGFVRHATQLMLSEPYGIITDMQQYLSDGKTVAIQASCAYMLDPFKNALRAAAIPFHNPYRPERGDWNPLRPSGAGLSASTRLLSFLRMSTKYHGEQADLWTYADVYNFASIMNATGNLKRGMKAKLEDWKKSQVKVTVPALLEVFTDEALSHMMDCDMPWYVEQVQKSRQLGMQFPLQIIAKGGLDAITKVPQVNIGTIHSFKGTQFDVVYIFPDLSMRMQIDMHNSHDARDAIIRMMYVGMTRCKEGLVLGGTINRGNFDFPRPEK